jgi:hypothetical protein
MSSVGALAPLLPHHRHEDLGAWIDATWQQYRAMVDCPGLELWGRPVLASGELAGDGRDATFWHIVTTGWSRKRRLDVRRASAIPRARAVLELAAQGDSRIVWWREPRTGKGRGWSVLLSPADYSCVVVLRECRQHFLLVTAYPVCPKRRRRLRERSSASWESGATRECTYRHVVWKSRPPESVPAALYAWADHLE